MSDKHPTPWVKHFAAREEFVGVIDAVDRNINPVEIIAIHNAIATERDELGSKLRYAHDALCHMYSMGTTALDVRTCSCGSCTNARMALADASCNVAYPPGERCWKAERDELNKCIEQDIESKRSMCEMWDRMRLKMESERDELRAKLRRAVEAVREVRETERIVDCRLYNMLDAVLAENAEMAKEVTR
jgi:hypothetical protein